MSDDGVGFDPESDERPGHFGVRGMFERANRLNACAAVLLGDDELAKEVATVRDMDGGDQAEVPLGQLPEWLSRYR